MVILSPYFGESRSEKRDCVQIRNLLYFYIKYLVDNIQGGVNKLHKIEELKEWCQNLLDGDREMVEALGDGVWPLLSLAKEQLEQEKREKLFWKEALQSLPNPVFAKNGQLEYNLINRAYEKSFSVKAGDLLGKEVGDLEYLQGRDRLRYEREDQEMLNNVVSIHYETAFVFADNQVHNSLYWSTGFEVPETGERGLIGEFVDISKEKNLEQQLSEHIEKLKLSYMTDFATGLKNRYALAECLPHYLVPAGEEVAISTSLIMADLDWFKSVNDNYGHLVGDQVLLEFAEVLKTSCRHKDLCVRFGGEEFLIVCPYANAETASMIAERICQRVRQLRVLPDGKQITVSIGVTEIQSGENQDVILNRVDQALYLAKNKGKDRVEIL